MKRKGRKAGREAHRGVQPLYVDTVPRPSPNAAPSSVIVGGEDLYSILSTLLRTLNLSFIVRLTFHRNHIHITMSKRRALTQLTRDDLDREDSPERDEPSSNSFETGIQVAPAETLEKRVIRKARRSLVSDHTGDDNVKTSPFVGLSLAASKPVDSPFAAFSSSAFKVTPSGLKSNLPVPKPSAEKASVNLPPQNGKSNGVEGIEPEDMERDPAYYKKLTNLNKTFKKWVLDFMEKGPYYDFTPVCRDYMSFISKLDEQFPILAANKSKQTVAQTVPPPVVQAVTAAPLLTSKPPSEAPSTPKFTFGASAGLGGAFGSQKSSTPTLFPMTMGTSSQPAIGTGPSFSFGQSGSSQPTFGSAFGTPVAAPAAVQSVNGEDDENYEPPQPETVKVEEKDAIFSKE